MRKHLAEMFVTGEAGVPVNLASFAPGMVAHVAHQLWRVILCMRSMALSTTLDERKQLGAFFSAMLKNGCCNQHHDKLHNSIAGVIISRSIKEPALATPGTISHE